MKKLSRISLTVLIMLITSIIALSTVWGYSAIRKIEATANDNIKIYHDGNLKSFTETDGSKISPVIINGRTYLPLRAVADLAGMGVEWDGSTQSINLSSNNSAIPYKDNTPVSTEPGTGSTPVPQSTAPASTPNSSGSGNASKSAATLKDPVKFGDTYSWSASEDYIGNRVSADYSFRVKKVEPITVQDISDLGFKTDEDSYKFNYAMVTVEQTVSNAKIQSGDAYLRLPFYRDIFGSKTPSGSSIIGGTDYAFDGSLSDSSRGATEDSQGYAKKIIPGEVHNYKYEGKIILPLSKYEKNYLVITKDGSLEYSDRYIYFCLE